MYVRCNLCGSDDYTIMYPSNVGKTSPTIEDYTSTINKYGVFHNIVKCNSCGLLYMNPRDVNTTYLYKEVIDTIYLESWEDRAKTFKEHLKILKNYKPIGNLLDIGCYAGIFLYEAQKNNYNVTGIEPSVWASEYARQKTGAKIITGSSDEVYFPKDSFDIVTLWDVIEHLENPSSCLSTVYDYLKADGIVAITTHDIESFIARMMGKSYPWLMRFHLYHFTPETLSALLLKNGLEPILIKYYTKRFSLKYILSRFGIIVRGELFEKINIPINTGDMFMILAKKKT